MTNPHERLRYYVTGAIERGEAVAIEGIPADGQTLDTIEKPGNWTLYFYRAPTESECEAGGYDGTDSGLESECTAANIGEAIEFINQDGPESGFDSCEAIESSTSPSAAGDWVSVFYTSGRSVNLFRANRKHNETPTAASVRRIVKTLKYHCG